MPKPMTRKEWVDFATSTLHGAPPQKTLYRIYTTVDLLFASTPESDAPSIEDIVRAFIAGHGYDGLVDIDHECSCEMDDLAPCGEMSCSCQAGHKVSCDCGEGCDFHVAPGRKK